VIFYQESIFWINSNYSRSVNHLTLGNESFLTEPVTGNVYFSYMRGEWQLATPEQTERYYKHLNAHYKNHFGGTT